MAVDYVAARGAVGAVMVRDRRCSTSAAAAATMTITSPEVDEIVSVLQGQPP
jgi:hypothetical protein